MAPWHIFLVVYPEMVLAMKSRNTAMSYRSSAKVPTRYCSRNECFLVQITSKPNEIFAD